MESKSRTVNPEGSAAMMWARPTFVEICTNAEIGGYQDDFDREREPPPFLASAAGAGGSARPAEA